MTKGGGGGGGVISAKNLADVICKQSFSFTCLGENRLQNAERKTDGLKKCKRLTIIIQIKYLFLFDVEESLDQDGQHDL